MSKTKALDFSRLLGFETVSAEMEARVDFPNETLGDKLGAKVGFEPPPGPTLLQDDDFAAKLGAKVGAENV